VRSGGRRLVRGGRTATRLVLVWSVGAGSVGVLSVTLPGFDIGQPINALVVSATLSAPSTEGLSIGWSKVSTSGRSSGNSAPCAGS